MKARLLVSGLLLCGSCFVIGCGDNGDRGGATALSPGVAWVARYVGLGDAQEDQPKALAVDGAGNVYVTGHSGTTWPSSHYATIKYGPGGDQLWAARYEGPAQGHHEARSIALDGSGNVYVTGSVEVNRERNDFDYGTVKYSPDGNEAWVAHYGGESDFSKDQAVALSLDGTGNIYVTGSSDGDIATLKYDRDGNEMWARRFDAGSDGDVTLAFAKALAVDEAGNVYIAGDVNGAAFLILGYNTDGTLRFATESTGSGEYNAAGLVLDGEGSIYFTGTADGDYLTIKYSAAGEELWSARYDGPGHGDDMARALSIDREGNVYVTGCTSMVVESGQSTQTTVRYDSDGNLAWVRHYNGSGNPYTAPRSLAVGGQGDIYVSGVTGNVTAFSTAFSTIRYDADGTTVWAAQYNGPGDFEGLDLDDATAMAVDASSNVYVTGTSYASTTSSDYATIKYVQR